MMQLPNGSGWPRRGKKLGEDGSYQICQITSISGLAMETDEKARRCVAALMQQRCDLDERLPLYEQHHVQAAMHSFHAEMSSVQIPTCSTCMETFPGMKINSRTSECLRCTRDRREPKLYSSSNNMHPGAVPTELQVRL